MYGKYPYKVVECPRCENKIKVYNDEIMKKYNFRGRFVTIEECGVCGRKYIVTLDAIVAKDKSFEAVEEAYLQSRGDIILALSFTEDLYERLLEDVITEDEVCIECTDELYEELEPLP